MNGLLFLAIYSLLMQSGEVLPSSGLGASLPPGLPPAASLASPPGFGAAPVNNFAGAPARAEVGWKTDARGKLSMIIQIDPSQIEEFSRGSSGSELELNIPPAIQNAAQGVIIRIGTGPVERIPINPQPIASNNMAPPRIANLDNRGYSNIDPSRPREILPTAGNQNPSPLSSPPTSYPHDGFSPGANLSTNTQSNLNGGSSGYPNTGSEVLPNDRNSTIPPIGNRGALDLLRSANGSNSANNPFPANPSGSNYSNNSMTSPNNATNYANTNNPVRPPYPTPNFGVNAAPTTPYPQYAPPQNPQTPVSTSVFQNYSPQQLPPAYANAGSLFAANTLPNGAPITNAGLGSRFPNTGMTDLEDAANGSKDKLLPFLLLFSIVGNVYLGLWMSHLRSRYRELLSNMRGIPVSDLDN